MIFQVAKKALGSPQVAFYCFSIIIKQLKGISIHSPLTAIASLQSYPVLLWPQNADKTWSLTSPKPPTTTIIINGAQGHTSDSILTF